MVRGRGGLVSWKLMKGASTHCAWRHVNAPRSPQIGQDISPHLLRRSSHRPKLFIDLRFLAISKLEDQGCSFPPKQYGQGLSARPGLACLIEDREKRRSWPPGFQSITPLSVLAPHLAQIGFRSNCGLPSRKQPSPPKQFVATW